MTTGGITSKTAQGKTRKSTSLKTGTGVIEQSDQMWQINSNQVPVPASAVHGQPGSAHSNAVY